MALTWERAAAFVWAIACASSSSACADDVNDDGFPFTEEAPSVPTPGAPPAPGPDDGDPPPGASPEPGLDCGPSYDDDIDLEAGARVELPGAVVAVVNVGGDTVVCGDGFVALIDVSGELEDTVETDADCTAVAALGNDEVVAGFEDGEIVSWSTDDDALDEVERASLPGRIHGVAASTDSVYAAVGDDGLFAGSVSALEAIPSIARAWGVAYSDGTIWVAMHRDGLAMLDADVPGEPTIVDTTEAALGVVAGGSRAIVLEGTHGWELVESGQVIAAASTGGVVVDATFAGGHILTAEGHAVVRYRADGESMVPVAIEHRWDRGSMQGGWIRSIEPVGQGFIAGYGSWAVPLEVDAFEEAPDVWVDVPSVAMSAEPGEVTDSAYLIKNVGTATLVIGEPEIGAPFEATLASDGLEPSDDCDEAWEVPPGGSALIELEFDGGDGSPRAGTLRIPTNDPDEGTLQIPVDGNRAPLQPGDEAPDFTALTIDGDLFRLADHRGKVVLLKLFNFGCSTCAEEFPEIETELVDRYDDDEFIAVGVNTSHRTAYAASLADEANLTLPMVLDLDSEAFRHYRLPSTVFPLHVVIDAEGRVAEINNETGLEAIEAAVESAM